MEILKATNLSKIYQTGESAVYALNDVTLSLEEGSFVAITGPSGSGKSTLLHLLSGLDKPTHGTVTYRDKDLYKYNDNQLSVLRRRRFGFVFQSYNLVKELTGYENMLLPVMLDGKAGREVLTLLRTVSHELGITLVLVTHDMKVAEQADRIIQLSDGQIAADSGVSL